MQQLAACGRTAMTGKGATNKEKAQSGCRREFSEMCKGFAPDHRDYGGCGAAQSSANSVTAKTKKGANHGLEFGAAANFNLVMLKKFANEIQDTNPDLPAIPIPESRHHPAFPFPGDPHAHRAPRVERGDAETGRWGDAEDETRGWGMGRIWRKRCGRGRTDEKERRTGGRSGEFSLTCRSWRSTYNTFENGTVSIPPGRLWFT